MEEYGRRTARGAWLEGTEDGDGQWRHVHLGSSWNARSSVLINDSSEDCRKPTGIEAGSIMRSEKPAALRWIYVRDRMKDGEMENQRRNSIVSENAGSYSILGEKGHLGSC